MRVTIEQLYERAARMLGETQVQLALVVDQLEIAQARVAELESMNGEGAQSSAVPGP